MFFQNLFILLSRALKQNPWSRRLSANLFGSYANATDSGLHAASIPLQSFKLVQVHVSTAQHGHHF
jgi:hypothetical protein